jgi:heme/copper-type cytochrome/quinol oxidase subunit 4
MIVFLVVFGSVWIMHHLNQNMMPAGRMHGGM